MHTIQGLGIFVNLYKLLPLNGDEICISCMLQMEYPSVMDVHVDVQMVSQILKLLRGIPCTSNEPSHMCSEHGAGVVQRKQRIFATLLQLPLRSHATPTPLYLTEGNMESSFLLQGMLNDSGIEWTLVGE